MSRIGKQPVAIPAGVSFTARDRRVEVKGPKGSLGIDLRPEIDVKVEGQEILIQPNGRGGARQARAYHGLTRALVANMIEGVSKGFEKKLEIQGVGWNAQAQGNKIQLNIGFCHPVQIPMPAGVSVETPNNTTVILRGPDKQVVGQIAAVIRKVRPPEPYKGKGIRYAGEFVRRKSGKSFGS